MTDPAVYDDSFKRIRKDMSIRTDELKSVGKALEAQRLRQRTEYDLQMIREVGYVNGIENYSRYFDGRNPGDPPFSLLDYFDYNSPNKDWLCIIDESHITLPQIRGMYNGDKARKDILIDYGFRLPSALDNRPLRYEEFMQRTKQLIYVSATPNDYEQSLPLENKDGIVQQLIRPTGLVDPEVSVKPTRGQIEDILKQIKIRTKKKERILITTLTKRMAEDLSSYLEEKGIKVSYLHSDVATLDRQDVLDKLRFGDFDVLVGINLLREGLDLPEVSLVIILDADKEGFLRSKTSLIQTMGRAARNLNSQVILYADKTTHSMEEAIKEVDRRRAIQVEYNRKHHITPKSIQKEIRARLVKKEEEEKEINELLELSNKEVILPDEKEALIRKLRTEMRKAAGELDFERALQMRNYIKKLNDSD